jgi:purine-binding chemotaxis protein CheW
MSFDPGERAESWHDRVFAVLRGDLGAEDSGPVAPGAAAARLEVLSFEVGGETYGVNISEVAEILMPRPVTPLPRTPDFVRGVVSLRGAVLPLLDLSRRLGLPLGEARRESRIVVLKDGDERVGFWVDRVAGVVRFANDGVQPSDFASAVDPRYLRGIGYDRRGTLVAVLRPETLCDFVLEEP